MKIYIHTKENIVSDIDTKHGMGYRLLRKCILLTKIQYTPIREHVRQIINNYVHIIVIIVQELCENRGGRPELVVLTSLLVSVDVKNYCTVLRHWSQLVPNMSTDI